MEIHNGVSRAELLEVIASAGYVSKGVPVEPLPGETEQLYADDKTYAFDARSLSCCFCIETRWKGATPV